MSKHHIGLDVALALIYWMICTVLLLVLSLPLPYMGLIKQRMGPVINYLLYALIIPAWVLFNSINRLRNYWNIDVEFRTSQGQQYKYSSKVIKQQRNIIIGAAGVISYILLLRFYTLLGGAKYMEKSAGAADPFRPSRMDYDVRLGGSARAPSPAAAAPVAAGGSGKHDAASRKRA